MYSETAGYAKTVNTGDKHPKIYIEHLLCGILVWKALVVFVSICRDNFWLKYHHLQTSVSCSTHYFFAIILFKIHKSLKLC